MNRSRNSHAFSPKKILLTAELGGIGGTKTKNRNEKEKCKPLMESPFRNGDVIRNYLFKCQRPALSAGEDC